MSDQKYDYYRHDGALFRTRECRHGVDEVLGRYGDWVPYKGDTLEPVWQGSKLDEERVAAEVREREAERQALADKMADE